MKRPVLFLLLLLPALVWAGGSKQTGGSRDASQALIYATSTDPLGLDPALVDDINSAKIMSNIYEGLVKYAQDSTAIEPSLAESWTVSPDQLVYTFKLRKGVKFHDGTDFNAEAVKFNIDRQLAPQVTEDMRYAELVYGSVKNVAVVDAYTVTINLKEPSTPFMANLAMALGPGIVSPAAVKAGNNTVMENPVGTGPYRFVSWEKGQTIILTRNDAYWGKAAITTNLIFRTILETATRVVALNNGEVDIIDGIDANVVDQITGAGNKLFEATGMNVNYMYYNTTQAPANNPAVRKAIAQAINTAELTKALYKGYAVTATTILPEFIPGYSSSVHQIAYNPDASRAAFQAAGITKLNIITYSGARQYNTAGGQMLAEAVQSYLAQVGVTGTIASYDWATYKARIQTDDYAIGFIGWIGDNGDADNFLNLLASEDRRSNYGLWSNSTFKSLIAKAVSLPNGAERNALYAQAEQIQADDGGWLPISHARALSAYRPNISGYYMHSTGITPLAGVSKN